MSFEISSHLKHVTTIHVEEEEKMTREELKDAKKQSAEIAKLLKEGNLTPEERQKLETLQTALSGVSISTWLPFGWGGN